MKKNSNASSGVLVDQRCFLGQGGWNRRGFHGVGSSLAPKIQELVAQATSRRSNPSGIETLRSIVQHWFGLSSVGRKIRIAVISSQEALKRLAIHGFHSGQAVFGWKHRLRYRSAENSQLLEYM